MPKFEMVRLYRTEDVPDELLEEVQDLMDKMSEVLTPIFAGHNGSIVLSAFNRYHAAMICTLVTERGLSDATKTEAIGLIKNVEHISGQKFGCEECKND